MPDEKKLTKSRLAYMPIVLLALAAGVVVMTMQMLKPPQAKPKESVATQPALSLADRVLASAGSLMQAGQFAQASQLMETYISKFPDDVQVRPLLAQCQMALGENGPAERTIDEVIRRSPRQTQVLWLKGELVRLRGQNDYINFFRKAVEEATDVTPDYYSRFGMELLVQQKNDEAVIWLQRAIDGNCTDSGTIAAMGEAMLLTGQAQKARDLLERARDAQPSSPELALLLAQANRACGDADTAASILEETLENYLSAEVYMELAEARLLQDRPLLAAAAFVEAANFTPFRAKAATRAAQIYLEQGELTLAREQIEHAYQASPADPIVLKIRSQVLAATQPASAGSMPAK